MTDDLAPPSEAPERDHRRNHAESPWRPSWTHGARLYLAREIPAPDRRAPHAHPFQDQGPDTPRAA